MNNNILPYNQKIKPEGKLLYPKDKSITLYSERILWILFRPTGVSRISFSVHQHRVFKTK